MSAAIEYYSEPPGTPGFCPHCGMNMEDATAEDDGWRCSYCGRTCTSALSLDEVRRDAAADRADDWYNEQ